jgi:hypothetical protein
LPTRARAKAAILERLEQFVDQELRVLVGFDFPHWLSRWVRVNRR